RSTTAKPATHSGERLVSVGHGWGVKWTWRPFEEHESHASSCIAAGDETRGRRIDRGDSIRQFCRDIATVDHAQSCRPPHAEEQAHLEQTVEDLRSDSCSRP